MCFNTENIYIYIIEQVHATIAEIFKMSNEVSLTLIKWDIYER